MRLAGGDDRRVSVVWSTQATTCCCRTRAFRRTTPACGSRRAIRSITGCRRTRILRSTSTNSDRQITPKTKAAVVISPSNPTGKISDGRRLETDRRGLDGTGIYLISDEIYSDLYFGERPHSASEFYDKTIIVSGLSKSLSMTGWRLGWAASHRRLMSQADPGAARIFDRLHVGDHAKGVAACAGRDEAEAAKQHARDSLQKARRFSGRSLRQRTGLACDLARRCVLHDARRPLARRRYRDRRKMSAESRDHGSRRCVRQRRRKVFCGSRSAIPKRRWPRA